MKIDLSSWKKRFITKNINQQNNKKKRFSYKIGKGILVLISIIILGASITGGVGLGYFASLVKDEPIRSYEKMKKDIYNYEETSELYFANDIYLGKLYSDLEREEVKLTDVSDDLINAVVSTEDKDFYKHDGIVPKSILRAVYQEVTNSPIKSGGSTLTQQLIKNQILTNEVSFERKAKEILLALRLEKFFDKKEILEAYLNVSTFGRNSSGRNIAGVQSAAKGIFGVNASEVNLPQAAFIAGLPQSPFGYTPYTNTGELKDNLEPGIDRMHTVLKRMYDNGKINQKQYKKALAYDIKKDFITIHENPIDDYPWVTFEIEKRAIEIMSIILAEKDGYKKIDLEKDPALQEKYHTLADRDIRQNGYKIHSTINKDIYDQFNKVVKNFNYYGSDHTKKIKDPKTGKMITVNEPVEVGAVLIENKTGKIISFVGGRDFDRQQLNHATSAKRSNGSTMKPLLVYAPAIESGKLSPGSILPDVPLRLNPASSQPWPSNYGGGYHGLVTARKALAESYNIPAVKAYVDIMDKKPAKYLEKMGFSSLSESDYTNRSTALGGLTNGVTVEENTNAFGTFANKGQFIDAYLIDKIVDKDGHTIYKHKVKPVKVFSPQTAYLTYDMMRDVISGGTASSLNSRLKFSSDWAGKTGTGQDYKDAWFVATNPNVSFGTWIGYDEPKPLEMMYRGLSYSNRNIYLWASLMNAAYDVDPNLVDPNQTLKMPNGIVSRSYCALTGLLPSEGCAKAGLVRTDLFNAKFVPTKGDNGLTNGKFVVIGGKQYPALDSTPAEFTESGLTINADFLEKLFNINTNPEMLIPKNNELSNALFTNNEMKDNGKKPNAVKVSLKGNVMTWGSHSEKDIVGYRVYNQGKKVASIKANNTLQFKLGNGSYYITAVDIAGNESGPSNKVTTVQETKPTPIIDKKPTETGEKVPTPGKDTIPPKSTEENTNITINEPNKG